MPTRRSRPWPAYVDLFAALFIATMGGFVLLASPTPPGPDEEARAKLDTLKTQVQQMLEAAAAGDYVVFQDGDDIKVDLYIPFGKDSDRIIAREDQELLRMLGESIKGALDQLDDASRDNVEVVIGGHTDSLQPISIRDPRTRYLYNWNLSAMRATSVLYEFRDVGLSPPNYNVVAIGYADSVPKEGGESAGDHRRTSVWIRPDYAAIVEDYRASRAGEEEPR